MKKNLSILVLVALMVPSIAFASWWNPLSWFNNWTFRKAEPQSQIINNTYIPPAPSFLPTGEETSIESPVVTPAENIENKTTSPTIASKIVKTPKVVDICLNVDGIQAITPQGFTSQNNLCTAIQVIVPPNDVCENIEGVQTSVPNGMVEEDKECSTPVINDICENIEGIQTSVPNGMTEDDGECSTPSSSTSSQNTTTVEPHTVSFSAGATYTDDNVPGQQYDALNGIIVQVTGYWESDNVTAVLKDGNTVLNPLPNSEQKQQSSSATGPCDKAYPCSVENYYDIPLEDHTYTVQVTVNGVTKSSPVTVNSTIIVAGGSQLGFASMLNQGNPETQFKID
jgi:hypothetical protein